MKIHAVVPVKDLDHAKTRLSGVLNHRDRRKLASYLLHDTLTALVNSSLERVFVVTGNRTVERRAKALGATPILETKIPTKTSSGVLAGPHDQLNAALEEGRQAAVNAGAEAILTLPVDLILLPSYDLDAIFSSIAKVIEEVQSEPPAIFLESDERGDGTNFLLQSPPSSIDFLYGEGSFRAHEGNAIARGRRFRELDEPGLRWDLDEPNNIKCWAEALSAETEASYELATRILAAKKAGKALPFLLKTEWAEPLEKAIKQLPKKA